MNLPALPLLIVDTETTGFVPRTHRIIEFAAMRFDKGALVREYEQLLSCSTDIPPHIEVLTQIKTADLQGKPTFADIKPQIEAMITDDTLLVGQNIPFDLGMLKGEGLDLTHQPWIDTSMLASLLFPECRSFSLGYLSQVLTLDHTPKHRALGDVRATAQLLSLCVERLSALPDSDVGVIKALAARGPQGYRRFFESIEGAGKKRRPTWVQCNRTPDRKASETPVSMDANSPLPLGEDQGEGVVQLIEEPLHPDFIAALMRTIPQPKPQPPSTWIAVKNLEATLRRIPLPGSASVFYPPELMVHQDAVKALLAQPAFTTDELTLAIKLHLYEPTVRADLPIHGEEYAVWNGKLAATKQSIEYRAQCENLSPLVLLDHAELLKLLADADSIIPAQTHIVIDDASMLEDTATAAYGWTCALTALRAASQGNNQLMKFTDLLELWVEKTRNGTDLRYIVRADLETAESDGLREQLTIIRGVSSQAESRDMSSRAQSRDDMPSHSLPKQALAILDKLALALEPENLSGRIAWIETFADQSKFIKSVPENIALLLQESVYATYPTTLLIPTESATNLRAIVNRQTQTCITAVRDADRFACSVAIDFPKEWTIADIVRKATGKTVVLMSGKRAIEDVYIKHFAECERRGITLLCQGMSGGQGRMQAEFAAASEPAVLIATPWTYETYELPADTVDHLYLQALPFDHPSHAVIGRRAEQFANPFLEYSLPRLKHRLFRLIRTFCRHRTENGMLTVLDDRINTKAYGKDVRTYLESFAGASKTEEGQMNLL